MPEVVTLLPAFLRVLKVAALAGNKARVWFQAGPGAADHGAIDLALDGWAPSPGDANPLHRAAAKAATAGLQEWADDLLKTERLWAIIDAVVVDQNGRRCGVGKLVQFFAPTCRGVLPSDMAAGMAAGFRFPREVNDRATLAELAARVDDGFQSVARALNESLHAEA